jgi:pre-mRNA-splicing factor SYF1
LLCQIINNYPEDLNLGKYNKDLNVDKVIRHGIKKYTDEVGNLWVTLANYYIKIGLIEKAREIFEEALEKILTPRDFSLIYNSYLNFEQEMMKQNLFYNNDINNDNYELTDNKENKNLQSLELNELENALNELNIKESDDYKKEEKFKKEKLLEKQSQDKSNLQKFNFIRVNNLIQRRPFLKNSTILRRNPNNVSEWLKRIELMKEKKDLNLIKNLYEECLNTIKINLAYGRLSEIYISYANFFEENNNIKKANEIYYKGCNLNFKNTEENVNMWCLWCEMNVRQKRYQDA